MLLSRRGAEITFILLDIITLLYLLTIFWRLYDFHLVLRKVITRKNITMASMNHYITFAFSIFVIWIESVSGQPKIQVFNFPSDVVVGQKASAACTAIAGSPPLEFRWLKNGKEISAGGQIILRTMVDVSVLVIESVDLSSSGNYTCILKTSRGTDSHTAFLEVKEPSKWTNSIQDQDLKAGENATIICKAEGVPPPQTYWVKKTEADLESSFPVENQQKGPGLSRLLLINSKPEDSGYYSCIAHNNVGKPIDRNIYVNVLGSC